jgi:hypothetical protein
MLIVCILSSLMAYDRGWNYSWYHSRGHWFNYQLRQMATYADDPRGDILIYECNGKKYTLVKVDNGVLLKIVAEDGNKDK